MSRRLGRYVVDQVTFRRWLAGYDVWAEGLVPGAESGRRLTGRRLARVDRGTRVRREGAQPSHD